MPSKKGSLVKFDKKINFVKYVKSDHSPPRCTATFEGDLIREPFSSGAYRQ